MIRAMAFSSTNVFFHEKTCGLVFKLGSACVSAQICMCVLSAACVRMLAETTCLCMSASFFHVSSCALLSVCLYMILCVCVCMLIEQKVTY